MTSFRIGALIKKEQWSQYILFPSSSWCSSCG